ncbi:MAG: DUF4340 domain-containing protein [Myxococcota bacterium]|nr:DUF4340 domain-containing protein [Myxococcota bacterium]MDW8362262.1 hypothetical protein [Myxococcales bacterium]
MRGLWHHVALAALGVGAAWWVYRAGDAEERSDEEVVVLECESSALRAFELVTKQRRTRVEARGGQGGTERYFWVTVERTPEQGERTRESFVGSKNAEELAGRLAPLRAIRSLGEVQRNLLSELKLEGAETHLVIECGGKTHRYALGETTFGSGDRYARLANGGPVFLLSSEIVRDLESAEFRLMQRELHRFERREVETVLVKAHGREQTLLQRHRLDPDRAEWVDADTPDQRNELYGNWLDRVGRLRVQSYLAPDAAPGSDLTESAGRTTVVEIAYRDPRGRQLGRLELVRVDAAEPQYYARTETTRGWVKVLRSVAQQVDDDARPVVGLDPVTRTEAPTTRSDGGTASDSRLPAPTSVTTPGAASPSASGSSHAGHAH